MRRTVPLLLRAVAVLVTALIAGSLVAPTPAAAFGPTFAADSGDACPYGVTRGTIDWVISGSSLRTVIGADIRGSLTDQPASPSPTTACRNDGFYSVATFTAVFAGGQRQARAIRADNQILSFGFRLIAPWTTAELDRVEVQVCRHPLVTLPPSYCGRTQIYLAPELN